MGGFGNYVFERTVSIRVSHFALTWAETKHGNSEPKTQVENKIEGTFDYLLWSAIMRW